jgi:hypothetical protein
MSEYYSDTTAARLAALAAAVTCLAVVVLDNENSARVCGETVMVVDGAEVGSEANKVVVGRPFIRFSGDTLLKATHGADGKLVFEDTGTYQNAELYDLSGNHIDSAIGCGRVYEGDDPLDEGVTINIQFPLDNPAQTADAARGMAARLSAPVS